MKTKHGGYGRGFRKVAKLYVVCHAGYHLAAKVKMFGAGDLRFTQGEVAPWSHRGPGATSKVFKGLGESLVAKDEELPGRTKVTKVEAPMFAMILQLQSSWCSYLKFSWLELKKSLTDWSADFPQVCHCIRVDCLGRKQRGGDLP